jgi:glycosyltransferase involved in cell wall biosynthesis
LKVLFIYRFLTLGGCEAVLRARLDGLRELGIESHAWFFHDLGGRSMFRGIERQISIGSVEDCWRMIRRRNFDLVSTLDTNEILPFFLSPQRSRLVIEVHSPYRENIEYLRHVNRVQVGAYFVPSYYQGEVVKKLLGRGADVRVIPNPLRQQFVLEPRKLQPPNGFSRPVVAWLGRMDELKNWRAMIRIASHVLAAKRDVDFWIVGRPADRRVGAELLELARKEQILEHIRWFNGVPHDCVPAVLDLVRDSGGLMISTSRGDSFGMTVAEAMARACPVLVPGRSPFTEFVEDQKTGLYYDLKGLEKAAGRVRELLEDSERRRRLGWAGRESILATYSPKQALRVLGGQLRSMVSRG